MKHIKFEIRANCHPKLKYGGYDQLFNMYKEFLIR